jgi:CheY-like chemotaxis protein
MELAGKRLLVLEDEYWIGLELERIAEECGAKSVHIVTSISQLMEWIASEDTCDLVILEVEARGISSLEAAALLQARSISLIFTSAYDADLNGIDGFPGVPVVGKPYGRNQIVQAAAVLDAGLTARDRPSGELV